MGALWSSTRARRPRCSPISRSLAGLCGGTRWRRYSWPRPTPTAAARRLALDPLHEPAHRQLIRAYAAGGDRSAALEQYRECVRVLDRELGVRPLDETTALYHAIAEGTYALVPAVPLAASRADPE